MTTRQVEQTMSKLQALSLLTNSINRDQALRNLREAYWRLEGQELAEVVQEEEVMAHINSALGRMDMQNVQGQIGHAADTVLAGVDSLSASQNLEASGAPAPVEGDS
jgi:DNA-binding protein Fis